MNIDDKKYTLSIIASSRQIYEKINKIINKENFILTFSGSGHQALRELKETSPDLIIYHPRHNLSHTCSIIRDFRSTPSCRYIPIIFILSIQDEAVITNCLNFGSSDFLSLPLREKELLLRIRHQLALIEARRTIEHQNEQLRQTLQARDKLYSVIAHDLRSPIGTIKMINSAIEAEKEKITDTGIRKKFEMINDTTEEAFNLLENLLRWTRNQNGKTKVIPAHFDLSVMVRQVLSLFTTIAKAKNITLYNQVPAPLFVHADEDMIKTVLRNLISNAIKFTYPGGEVKISTRKRRQEIILAVKDNGQGIKKENQCRILQEGQAVSTYGTRNEKGSGLGLALSLDFIKMNHGRLYFTSEEGKGTTFCFTLPLSEKFSTHDRTTLHTSEEPPMHR